MTQPKEEIYLHAPTMTLGLVIGDFIFFRFNNRNEESFFPYIKREWTYIGEL